MLQYFKSTPSKKILFLGVGRVAEAVARNASSSYQLWGSTRTPEKLESFKKLNINPLLCDSLIALPLDELASENYVLITFPPDDRTDAVIAPLLSRAAALIYISSTTVYGDRQGAVDENTPCSETVNNRARIEAEKIWRQAGATILRVPGFYDRSSGLHIRLKNGSFKLAGNGGKISSRIHLDDLAQIVLATFNKAPKEKLYVVGDLHPAPQLEVVNWLCKRMSLPAPPSVDPSCLHYTHHFSRAVIASKVLNELGIKLRYPSYKEGYGDCI